MNVLRRCLHHKVSLSEALDCITCSLGTIKANRCHQIKKNQLRKLIHDRDFLSEVFVVIRAVVETEENQDIKFEKFWVSVSQPFYL